MTVYDWPDAFLCSECSILLDPNTREFESPFTRAYQSIDLLGERFRMTVSLPPRYRRESGALEAFFNKQRGVNRIRAWHLARPEPVGTLRGAPTLAAAAAQGAAALSVSGSGTLAAGDMLGVGGLLFQVAEDCSGAGTIAVPLVNRARIALASGAAVTWYRPSSTWRLADPRVPVRHSAVVAQGVEVELIETW